MTPLDALKAKLEAGQLTVNVGDITQRLEGIKNIRKAEEDAVKTAEDYKAGLVKKDCGYVEAPDRVDLIPGIGVVVDTDGNVGAQAEVSLLYRVLPSVGVGGYVNASLLKREAKDSRTHDLGIAVETVDETDTTRRYLGGGATVSLSLASWLELQASLGAAWNRLEESKEINRLGETQTLSSSRHEVVGEASIGPKFSYKRFMCRPAVRTNTKFDGADFTFDCGYNF
ncbi:hypothetical protein HZC30_04890 [Candidatus Woesearchaeota archaeon]|nr:hypothetical protein [Candidatus Woesearchaeota archaeon]